MNVNAEEHFLVGGCTASGWNSGLWQRSQVQMVKVGDTSEWICCLKLTVADGDDGRFKIPNSAGGWDGYWAPAQGTVLTPEWSDMSTNGSGDYKWCVAEEGIYLVTINTETSKIKAEKLDAPTKDGDFYLVGSVNDYYYAAGAITSGEQTSKIRLTADLDFTDKGFFPLASDKQKFKSEIDGAGHIIDHAVLKDDGQNIGLIRYATDGANIHDLIMGMWCYFEGNAKVGGLVGFARDGGTITVSNVINSASVKATGSTDANAAGFIGCATDNTKVLFTNCANTGEVHGQDGQCAAYLGWSQSGTTLTNCWNSGDINNMEGSAQLYRNSSAVTATNCYDVTSKGNQGTKKDEATLASGELCFLLNGVTGGESWYQTIGTDGTPVPFAAGGHQKVYANGEQYCDGTDKGIVTYSNTDSGFNRDDHDYADGFCSACHAWDPDYMTANGEGWFEVATANQLRWMAEAVTEHNSTYRASKIKLTADIDYTAYTDQAAMFGKPSNVFAGTFDGQCHTVTVAFNNTADSETALFRRINSGTVKNLKVAGTIETNKSFAGGIVSGVWGNALIQNCEAAVTITDNAGGDGTHGGILARVSDKNNNNGGIQILNCLFSGAMNCPNREGSCAIVGWSDNGSTEVKVKNCLITGTINLKDSNCDLISRSGATVENCYYTCELQNNLKNGKNAIAATAEQTISGELAFLLGNENWFQNLPGDNAPVPFSTHATVYQNGSYQCDHKTPKGEASFSNVEGATYDDHVFGANDLCSGCKAVGQIGEKVDGAYQIENIGNLIKFAELVNAGETTAAANITADIEQGEAVYTPVGNSEHPYKGVFKGGFHTVTLDLSGNGGFSNQGIFGILTGGAEIYNLTVAGTITGASGAAGIAGSTNGGGDVQFINCGNEATIEATNANAGGILGVDMGSAAHIKMINCYNAGAIKGRTDNGGLSGWAGDNPDIINCYNIADVENGDGFIRCNGDKNFINTYGKNDITNEMLTSGELCYRLGDKNFRQVIGTGHPVLSDVLPNVYGVTVGAAGWATYVTPATVDLSPIKEAEGETYTVTAVDSYVHLGVAKSIPANEAILVEAAEGTYYINSCQDASMETNLLLAATEDITADGTQYVLAQVGDEVGFHKVKTGTTIAKGKGYLVINNASAKAFFPFGDETTAIDAVELIPADAAIYNVAGQKLQKLQKGINIINGKKVVIK